MQPTLCSRCKKNIATVFITRMEGDKTINEGLCLKCAKSLGLPQVNDMMQRMGITDEDLDNLNNEMMQAMDSIDNVEDLPGGEDDEESGKTATFPFLNRLFNNGGEPAPKEDVAHRGRQPPGEEGGQAQRQAEVPGGLLHLPEPQGQGGQAGPGDRPCGGDRASHSDPEPPPEEQPLPHR